MSKQIRRYSIFILVTVVVFFIFLLNIFLNSFSADYRIALMDTARFYATGSWLPLFHLSSELVGEVGVILRFTGAFVLLVFAIILVWKKTFSKALLRKAVLLEGIYYLFNIPFIIYLFVKPYAFANYGAATSYLLQILFVTPLFLILYFKLKNESSQTAELIKWGTLAMVGFVFALWVKHFLLAIYALPLNLSTPILTIGFLNSFLTILMAGLIMVGVCILLYTRKGAVLNTKGVGIALIVAGLYTVIFLLVSLFSAQYIRWFSLIDWWIMVFVVLGIGFLFGNRRDKGKCGN